MGLDLGIKQRFTKEFDKFAAWDVLLYVRGLVEAPLHSEGKSRVLKAWRLSDIIEQERWSRTGI